MSAHRKSPRAGWLIALVLSLAGAARSAVPSAAAPTDPSATFLSVPSSTAARPVPFCPEGEKRVCSMGPPPVCWCE